MRCHAEALATWPDEEAWQLTWRALVAPLTASTVRADGIVDLSAAEPVRLVGGTHLAPGATYRIAEDRLRTGRLEAAVGPHDRDVRITWSPHQGPGRAELIIHGLDRCIGIRTTSSLDRLEADLLIAPRPQDLLRLRLRLDWLAADLDIRVDARSDGHRVVCDLDARGVGLWRPTLAPVLAALDAEVARGLEDLMREVARVLAELPEKEPYGPPARGSCPRRIWLGTPAEAVYRIHQGMEEIGRRLQSVATTVAVLPWWQRTAGRWRRELAALPAGHWPPDEVLVTASTWTDVEREALARTVKAAPWRLDDSLDAVLHQLLEEHLQQRRELNEHLRRTMRPDWQHTPTQPLLSDENLDTRWLATPWSTIRRLMNLQSDAEAQHQLNALVAAYANR